MKLTKSLKLALKSLLLDVKMGEIVAKENILIFDGDVYEVGTEVFVKDAENEGEVIVAPDGEYTVIEDENEVKVIVVREGKIEEIRENETEIEDGITETEVEVEAAEEIVEETVEVQPAEETEETETEEVKVEDRVAALEGKMVEMIEGMTKVLNAIAAIEGRIEELEGKLAKIEAPAAEPAETEVEVETKMSKMSYLRKK